MSEQWELFRADGLGVLELVRSFERLSDATHAIFDMESLHKKTLTLHTTASRSEGAQVDLTIEYQGRHATYLIKNC